MTQPIKIGDKEIVKARPYTLLSTTLTTTPTQFAAAVPPFDPLEDQRRSAGQGRPAAGRDAAAGRQRGRLHQPRHRAGRHRRRDRRIAAGAGDRRRSRNSSATSRRASARFAMAPQLDADAHLARRRRSARRARLRARRRFRARRGFPVDGGAHGRRKRHQHAAHRRGRRRTRRRAADPPPARRAVRRGLARERARRRRPPPRSWRLSAAGPATPWSPTGRR